MHFGTTHIAVTGDLAQLVALRAELASTKSADGAFDAGILAPAVWHTTPPILHAQVHEELGKLELSGDILHDRDFLALSGALSQRFPGLDFRGVARFESTWPDVTVDHWQAGKTMARHTFAAEFHARFDRRDGFAHVIFYPRTPETDRAAYLLDNGIPEPGKCRYKVLDWTWGDDPDRTLIYVRQAGKSFEAFVPDFEGGLSTVLNDIDRNGGYRTARKVQWKSLLEAYPELRDHLSGVRVAREAEWAARSMVPTGVLSGRDDVPF